MATYLVLGNATPAATSTSTLVTGGTNGTIVSAFSACNKGATNDTIRVSVTKSGGSAYYLFYGLTLQPNASLPETPGWTLASGDVVSVYSTTGNTDFIAMGSNL